MKAEIWSGEKLLRTIDCDAIRGSDSLDSAKGNYLYLNGSIIAFLPETITVFLIKAS